jgi:hypothetical protein
MLTGLLSERWSHRHFTAIQSRIERVVRELHDVKTRAQALPVPDPDLRRLWIEKDAEFDALLHKEDVYLTAMETSVLHERGDGFVFAAGQDDVASLSARHALARMRITLRRVAAFMVPRAASVADFRAAMDREGFTDRQIGRLLKLALETSSLVRTPRGLYRFDDIESDVPPYPELAHEVPWTKRLEGSLLRPVREAAFFKIAPKNQPAPKRLPTRSVRPEIAPDGRLPVRTIIRDFMLAMKRPVTVAEVLAYAREEGYPVRDHSVRGSIQQMAGVKRVGRGLYALTDAQSALGQHSTGDEAHTSRKAFEAATKPLNAYRRSARTLILEFLANIGRAATTTEIQAHLVASGHPSTNPNAAMASTLSSNKGAIERVGRGLYKLSGVAAAPKTPVVLEPSETQEILPPELLSEPPPEPPAAPEVVKRPRPTAEQEAHAKRVVRGILTAVGQKKSMRDLIDAVVADDSTLDDETAAAMIMRWGFLKVRPKT